MSTHYTVKPGQYVWTMHPEMDGKRLCVIRRLYSRGEHEGMAQLRFVRWHPSSTATRSFLVPVATLDVAEPTDEQRATLDACNQGGGAQQ